MLQTVAIQTFHIQTGEQEWTACMVFLCWLTESVALDPAL